MGDTISSYDDFLQRVGESEGVRYEEAETHARAVMGILREVIGEGTWRRCAGNSRTSSLPSLWTRSRSGEAARTAASAARARIA